MRRRGRSALVAAGQSCGCAALEARDLRPGAEALAGYEPADVRPVPRRRDHQPVRSYEELEELDWDAYRERYGNIQRLDRILHAEGDDPNRYKLSKQADVAMLFYLF